MTQPRKQLTRHDRELGPMRFCRRCNEWWPDDADFWVIVGRAGTTVTSKGRPYIRQHDAKSCRACRLPVSPKALATRHRRRAMRGWLHRPGWCACCLAVKTSERLCHGCAGRYAGPLTGARLASFGLAGGVN